jgi:hypothetical protein
MATRQRNLREASPRDTDGGTPPLIHDFATFRREVEQATSELRTLFEGDAALEPEQTMLAVCLAERLAAERRRQERHEQDMKTRDRVETNARRRAAISTVALGVVTLISVLLYAWWALHGTPLPSTLPRDLPPIPL